VCDLDRVVPKHTSTAVYQALDLSVDSVRISAALTSHSEVSFLVLVRIPGLADPVSVLIDSGATSNFLDSSLAALPLFVSEPLDRPLALCLFDGKPATAGFIHESVKVSIVFTDSSTQDLSLLVTKLHPSARIVLGLPWLRSTNPTIDWATLSLTFKTGPRSVLPSVALARACTVAALRHEDIISDLSPVFNSIPELCTSSGPSPDQGGPDYTADFFCNIGAVLVKRGPPSRLLVFPPTRFHSTRVATLVGPVVILVFGVGHAHTDV